MSLAPARILHLPAGTLAPGAAADLTLINPDLPYIFSEGDIRSRSRNTPFLGQRLPGRAMLTMVDSRISYRKNLSSTAAAPAHDA